MKTTGTLLAAVGLCAGLLSASMANATPWTFFDSGTINSGYDSVGVFGSVGADLTGLQYSQLFTLDPGLYENQVAFSPYDQASYGALTGGTASLTVTVNGISQTYAFDLSQYNYGIFEAINYLTLGAGTGFDYDQVYQYQGLYTADGTIVYGDATIFSNTNPLNLLSLNYDQVWSYNAQPGDSGYADFFLQDTAGVTTSFSGFPTFISITGTNNVPEPATLALVGLGLLGLAAARRRKQDPVSVVQIHIQTRTGA